MSSVACMVRLIGRMYLPRPGEDVCKVVATSAPRFAPESLKSMCIWVMRRLDGIYYKGKFCPLWGGVYAESSNNPSFVRGGLADVSRALKAAQHDAAVVVIYED